MIYVKEGQYTEEEILDNNDNSYLFEEFLQILGERVRLKGFDKYKGGLDTVHDLTGKWFVNIDRYSYGSLGNYEHKGIGCWDEIGCM